MSEGMSEGMFHRIDPRPVLRNAFSRLVDYPHELFAKQYLRDLGLSWDTIRGKKILDLCSGSGELGYIAAKKGIEVVSLDNGTQNWKRVRQFSKPVPNEIIGDVDNLTSFPDSSYDLVITHDAIHYLGDLSLLIANVRRILKEKGEFRFNVRTNNKQGDHIEKFFTLSKEPNESDQQIIKEVVSLYENYARPFE